MLKRAICFCLVNMDALGVAAAPEGMHRAPVTPVMGLDAGDVYADDPVMSFLEAVPWDGVSLCFS